MKLTQPKPFKEIAMQLNLQITGLEKVQKQLAALSGPQLREAQAKAINDTAFHVRKVMQAEATKVFDRPTPYVLRSFLFEKATPDKLEATVLPTYYGGKGVDPQKILLAQEAGGARRDKRSESALRRVGILPVGYQTRIPTTPFPGSDDGRGNLKGSFLVQLLSYFQAFGEQGYKANMKEKTMKKLHGRGEINGYKTIWGTVFFVSYGKLRGNRSSHLGAGIWAKTGIHGSDVKPVLMFIKSANYQPIFSMERVAQVADAHEYMSKRMRYRIRQAFEGMQS